MTGMRKEDLGGWLTVWDDWLPLPSIGPFGLEFGFLACHVVILPLTFYCAEVVEKVFDAPSVEVSRWCYDQVTAKSNEVTTSA